MKITVTRRFKNIDRPAAYKYVYDAIVGLWKECVYVFVNEASKHIVIDSGMSQASLLPLAANVRLASAIQESIRGFSPTPYKGVYSAAGVWNPNGYRSQAEGQRRGTKAYELSFGTPMNIDLTFSFKILVYQWYLHEVGVHGKPTWDALKLGRRAFTSHFNAHYFKRVSGNKFVKLLHRGKS